jgi:hypothetical protein
MSYIALRSLKVQKADGTMEIRRPGDPVPEAATWKDVNRWVRRGWVAETDPSTIKSKKAVPRKKSVPASVKEKIPTEPPPARDPSLPPTREELSKLTKIQLIAVGLKYGLELSENSLKDELVEAVLGAVATE